MFEVFVNEKLTCTSFNHATISAVVDYLVFHGWTVENWAAYPKTVFLYSPGTR